MTNVGLQASGTCRDIFERVYALDSFNKIIKKTFTETWLMNLIFGHADFSLKECRKIKIMLRTSHLWRDGHF
jgi:hypothetical protein